MSESGVTYTTVDSHQVTTRNSGNTFDFEEDENDWDHVEYQFVITLAALRHEGFRRQHGLAPIYHNPVGVLRSYANVSPNRRKWIRQVFISRKTIRQWQFSIYIRQWRVNWNLWVWLVKRMAHNALYPNSPFPLTMSVVYTSYDAICR